MALHFFKKRFKKRPTVVNQNIKPKVDELKIAILQDAEKEEYNTVKGKKNNKKNSREDMFDKDKIAQVEDVIKEMQPEVKLVKADRGLIERTESSKIIITEDNRQVLND